MTYRCLICNRLVPSGSFLAAKHPAGGVIPVCSECHAGMAEDGGAYLERRLNSLAAERPRSGLITRLQVLRAVWDAGILPAEDDLEKAPCSSGGEKLLWKAVIQAAGTTPEERAVALCRAGLDSLLACRLALGHDPLSLPPLQEYSPGFRNSARVLLEREFGLPKNLSAAVVFGFLGLDEAFERARLESLRQAEAERTRAEKEQQKEDRLLAYLEGFLTAGDVPAPDLAARKVLNSLRAKAAQGVSKWERDARSREAEKKAARSVLAALEVVALSGAPTAEKVEALRQAVVEFAGWKKLERWFALLRDTGASLITRREWEKQKIEEKRKAAAEERARQAKKEHEIRLARERELVKALRFRLSEMGVSEPLTSERIRRLQKMLPEKEAEALELRQLYNLFGFSRQEPAWLQDAPDPAVLEGFRRSISDDVLLESWNDRWVTAGTVAKEFGISVNRAREIMDAVGFIETRNPHYRSAEPMRLVRMSRVNAWVSANREKVEKWVAASSRAHRAYQRRLDEKVAELRSLPERISSVAGDPAPLVCFWLTILNRAAKSGHPGLYKLKDDALRMLVRVRPPTRLGYVEGGDKEEEVWLCDRCLKRAREADMHPLDYIDIVGPCGDCHIEPAQPRYYDLYEIEYVFDGIGKFSYHVPYGIGRDYLPDPEQFSEETVSCRGLEGGWAFGRSLNKIERMAFSMEEIKENLLAALGSLRMWAAGMLAK